jgi:hypothetical protein
VRSTLSRGAGRPGRVRALGRARVKSCAATHYQRHKPKNTPPPGPQSQTPRSPESALS